MWFFSLERIKTGIVQLSIKAPGVIKIIKSKLQSGSDIIIYQKNEKFVKVKQKLTEELNKIILKNDELKQKKLDFYFSIKKNK